ncbi:hypothetical protein M9458_008331, partial [Cirrhinus mrigala]
MSDFHFNIKYRPRKQNSEADTLSRYPHDNLTDHLSDYSEAVPSEVIKAVVEEEVT